MKVVITGANGQVGRALLATAADAVPGALTLIPVTRDDIDLSRPDTIPAALAAIKADVIINCAAYTAVDRAETESALAHVINADAVAALRLAAARMGARLVQLSTDFVFDGAATMPIAPNAAARPISVYGASKLAGEAAAGPDALIIRTAWVYAARGANFVTTMLRLTAERDVVRVVADQMGSPTWATPLATDIWRLVTAEARGIHHLTDAGVASWYDFAVAIRHDAEAVGLLRSTAARVEPITTADYPTAARRPAYSVLDRTATEAVLGTPRPDWRTNLTHMLKDLAQRG